MKKKILIILLPLLIIFGVGAGAFFYVNTKIYAPIKSLDLAQTLDSEDKNNDKLDYKEEKGVYNILLLGLDGRERESDSRTDSMIMTTIDTNNKKVKLTSFMRDLYVPIPRYGDKKLNSAFFLGGPELLIETLNQDFNTNIQYYVTIDFKAFQALVDKMGGIDIDIKDYEVKQLNKYIKEANWHSPQYIDGPGYQHLNGQQALSYCRIRKVGNNDYERTERQRKVLALLIKKARETSVFKLPELFSSVVPYIKTNISATKLLNLGYTVYKFGDTHVDSIRIPGDGMFEEMSIEGVGASIVPDFERNIAYLESFLSSNGVTTDSNVPVYMANNFHNNDKSIDKRGVKRKAVRVNIDREKIKSTSNNSNYGDSEQSIYNDDENTGVKKKKKRRKKDTDTQTIEMGNQGNDSIVNTNNSIDIGSGDSNDESSSNTP